MVMPKSGIDNHGWEGKTYTLTGGNDDTTINLAQGTTEQRISRIKVSVPAALGDLTIRFYDDTPATTALTDTLYIAAQPDEGFNLDGLVIPSGTLGIRITGWGSGGSTAYMNVAYVYKSI